ncbi:hypothetical protein [Paraburkholderia sp. J12]|nr:hypothetical protein [Paraburkholderia sp. J12]
MALADTACTIAQQPGTGRGAAAMWLKRRLQAHKVSEQDRNGNATTL